MTMPQLEIRNYANLRGRVFFRVLSWVFFYFSLFVCRDSDAPLNFGRLLKKYFRLITVNVSKLGKVVGESCPFLGINDLSLWL